MFRWSCRDDPDGCGPFRPFLVQGIARRQFEGATGLRISYLVRV